MEIKFIIFAYLYYRLFCLSLVYKCIAKPLNLLCFLSLLSKAKDML
jgi:hypothetical protein